METDHSLSGGRPKSTFVSRGATAFEIFWRGSPPVEPGLRFDSCFSRRIGWSSVLDIVEVSVQVSVKTARGQIGCPDPESGLVLDDFFSLENQLLLSLDQVAPVRSGRATVLAGIIL